MTAVEWVKFLASVAILCGIYGAMCYLGDRPTKRDRGWHRW